MTNVRLLDFSFLSLLCCRFGSDYNFIDIFPNPVTGNRLRFKTLVEVSPERVEVFDISGKKLLSANFNGIDLDITDLGPGTYFLSFVGSEYHQQPVKFVKF